jgi:hypothetical protein
MPIPDSDVVGEAVATPALGPGDDDPRSPVRLVAVPTTQAPLAPGDDDPKSPAVLTGAAQTQGPLAPGQSDGHNPDDGFHFLTPPAPGPGDPQSGPRSVVRVPKTPPPAAVTRNDEEQE